MRKKRTGGVETPERELAVLRCAGAPSTPITEWRLHVHPLDDILAPQEPDDAWRQFAEALHPASLAMLVRFGEWVLEGEEVADLISRALQESLGEPCRRDVLQAADGTVVAIITPLSGEPFDPVTSSVLVRQLRGGIERTLHQKDAAAVDAPVQVTPLAWIQPAEAVRANIDALSEMLDIIVNRRLGVQFMPVVSLADGEVYGYEALIRAPQGGLLKRMGLLFAAADRARMVCWLDLACLEQCFEDAQRLGLKGQLFFNMDAEGLCQLEHADHSLPDRARSYGLRPQQLVLEITERQAVDDYPRLSEFLHELRAGGIQIAIDDAGAGYSSLEAIADLRPDFVKVGRPLVRSIDGNGARRALLRSLCEYTQQIGAETIVEGIETRDELEAVIAAGADYGQGYLLSRPDDGFRRVRKAAREAIAESHRRSRARLAGSRCAIGNLARYGLVVSPATTIAQLARKAVNNPDLESAVVAEEGEVLGLVMRRVLDYAVASQGAESDAAVLTLADPHAMRVDAEAPVEEVARRAALRRVEQVHDDVIVLREGRYAGVVPVRLLLEALLESPGPSERRAA